MQDEVLAPLAFRADSKPREHEAALLLSVQGEEVVDIGGPGHDWQRSAGRRRANSDLAAGGRC
jgi:hypothetical protein